MTGAFDGADHPPLLPIDWGRYPGQTWRGRRTEYGDDLLRSPYRESGYHYPVERVERVTREIGESKMRDIESELEVVIARHEPRRPRNTRTHYERLLSYATRKLDQLERFPEDDPYAEGVVLRVVREVAGQRYEYAVIRAGNTWHTTGSHDERESYLGWGDLVTWLTHDRTVLIELMTPSEVIYERE